MRKVENITESNYGLEIMVSNTPGFFARLFGAKKTIKVYRGANDAWREIPPTVQSVHPRIVRFLQNAHETYKFRTLIAGR